VQLRPSEQIAHHAGCDLELGDLSRGDSTGCLAGHSTDLALELAHSRFAGVALHQLQQGRSGEGDFLLGESVFPDLARHQIALGDRHLLGLDIAGELDHFHPVQQGCRNVLDEVGGRDEEHLAQVERQPEVVVCERVVLGRIEHLEQRRGGIALEGDA
jgi:hypothetical protein